MELNFENCSNCGKLRWCASSQFAPSLCGEGDCNPFLMISKQQKCSSGKEVKE